MPQVYRQELFNRAFTSADNGGGTILVNNDFTGFQFILSVTSVTGTNPTLDLKWQEGDFFSNWEDMGGCAFEQITATGLWCLTVRPGIHLVNYRSIPKCLGHRVRPFFTIGGTDTPTFTMSGSFVFLP